MGSHEQLANAGARDVSFSDSFIENFKSEADELIANVISQAGKDLVVDTPVAVAVDVAPRIASQEPTLEHLEIEELEPTDTSDVDPEYPIEDDGRIRFADLNLPAEICSALKTSGYEYPTPIQAATIPAMSNGRDVLGQAQTGTGKTAAFALPLLSKIDTQNPATQVLVLTPTRELAIQVSESFQRYAQHMRGLRVCPIYGGQAYATQIHALQRGVHVVVGTPGRVMDHMRESRLRIDTLRCLVLDEADEMLRMGFVDDVQWILEHSPANRQIALFSATMPLAIREIADKYLKNPHVITIDSQLRSAETIRQRFVISEHRSKFEALVRILEAEEFDGMIVFVKTKIATVELADNLTKAGHFAVALNGDIPQAQRERTIEQLKQGTFNILVATDVAARGLDVQRISHVINYDLPVDSEAYVHRIGRTGRAGRSGEAIVFIAPRQRGFLREIDRAAGQMIQPMAIPTAREINLMRTDRFKSRMVKMCLENETAGPQFALFEKLIDQCMTESDLSASKLATALAMILQGDKPFFVEEPDKRARRRDVFAEEPSRGGPRQESGRERGRDNGEGSRDRRESPRNGREANPTARTEPGQMERFRVEVGRVHGVRPGNLVGAIANEAGLEASTIGHISIFDDYSTVDLPSGMPREVFKVLGRAWVVGRQLRISKLSDHANHRVDRKRKTRQFQ
ncbi:MAG: DEAD/DEAH box helicase [Pirellula sp.]